LTYPGHSLPGVSCCLVAKLSCAGKRGRRRDSFWPLQPARPASTQSAAPPRDRHDGEPILPKFSGRKLAGPARISAPPAAQRHPQGHSQAIACSPDHYGPWRRDVGRGSDGGQQKPLEPRPPEQLGSRGGKELRSVRNGVCGGRLRMEGVAVLKGSVHGLRPTDAVPARCC